MHPQLCFDFSRKKSMFITQVNTVHQLPLERTISPLLCITLFSEIWHRHNLTFSVASHDKFWVNSFKVMFD